MSAQALATGGPRPAEFLPPSLQPNAIAASAPRTERRLSFLVSCLLYSGCAAIFTFVARHPDSLRIGEFGTHPTVVPEVVGVTLLPQLLPPPPPGNRAAAPAAAARTPEIIIPLPSNVVPDTPVSIPMVDMSHAGLKPSETTGNGLVGAQGDGLPGATGDSSTGRPTVIELDISAVRATHQVQPSYPPLARLARVQGAVVLLMTIDPQGVPSDVKVLSSPHPSLEGESLRVARMWRFEPARLDGRPVSAQFRLTLSFVLKR